MTRLPDPHHAQAHHRADPLPFPVEVARARPTAGQRLQELARESNRHMEAMAFQLRCLGWFDAERDGPRAA